MLLISKKGLVKGSRYPFVATDILISSMKIADAIIRVKEEQNEEPPVKGEKEVKEEEKKELKIQTQSESDAEMV